MDRGWKPNVEISPSCPRCGSLNTKFCYYNNYSLTQPRYFCKGCRRYWTKGGSLRNVPVGGSCRKNRRGKSLRLSSDHNHSSSRSKSCPNIDSTLHTNFNGTNSSSSSTNSDGSHIDLALVYANFLNPQPDAKATINPNSSSNLIGMHELGGEFDPYNLDFTNLESNCAHHRFADSAIEAPSAGIEIDPNDQFMYYGGMDSMLFAQNKQMQLNDDGHKAINQQCSSSDDHDGLIKNGLPPLPGEEVGSLWSSSEHSINHNYDHNHGLEITQQQPVVGPESSHDPNSLLFCNWCPFDLSGDDHAFSRT